jgi:hypothetical protein
MMLDLGGSGGILPLAFAVAYPGADTSSRFPVDRFVSYVLP